MFFCFNTIKTKKIWLKTTVFLMQSNISAKDYKKYQTKSLIGLQANRKNKLPYYLTCVLCDYHVYAYSYRKRMEKTIILSI